MTVSPPPPPLPPTHQEAEVKFLLGDLPAFRERLLAAGATLHVPRVYERNVRFDDDQDNLRRQGKLLRLRQDNQAILTYKGVVADPSTTEVKRREELEVVVSDFDTAVLILNRLGFTPRQVYEKYRETFRLGAVEVLLDEMPFGHFVELEGEEAEIKVTATRLGLPWSGRILDNYLALMARLKDHYHLPFDDLTFANFAGRHLSIADVL
ncbi:MAG: class IV adenylate cyclase [Chloroflexota bacterium]